MLIGSSSNSKRRITVANHFKIKQNKSPTTLSPGIPYKVFSYTYLHETSSTNAVAMEILSNNDPKHHICVYSHRQKEGRGQIGREWYTGTDKNLALSIGLRDLDIPAKDQFHLNLLFSSVVLDLVKSFIHDNIKIKWPNDIYIRDKKVAGVLIQNVIKASKIVGSVLGVGINVNQSSFPEEIPNPISLYQVLGKESSLHEVRHRLMHLLTKAIESTKRDVAISKLRSAYKDNLYRIGEKHLFIIKTDVVEGEILDVADDGKLMISIHNNIRQFAFREIDYVI